MSKILRWYAGTALNLAVVDNAILCTGLVRVGAEAN